MKFLPLKVHNALDFIVGVVLILSPWIFRFNDVGGAAVAIPMIIGAASIILGLTTRTYSTGVLQLIPVKLHLTIDFLAGVFLLVSPWLFGFHVDKTNAWVPHVVVGAALIVVSLVTQTDMGEAPVKAARTA